MKKITALILAALFAASAWGQVTTNPSVTGVPQPANNVAITGGSINGTTIGATTPAAGTFTGLSVKGATSGTVTIAAQATAGTPTLTLPTGTGTFAVTASAPLSLNATTGNLTVTGAAGQVLAGATPAFTATPTLGVAGATLGTLSMTGNTSGTVLITPQATAGSPTLTLPNTSGTFAVGASGTLSLSATTGALTWSGASPGDIGGGTPGAGTFTTLQANTSAHLGSGASGNTGGILQIENDSTGQFIDYQLYNYSGLTSMGGLRWHIQDAARAKIEAFTNNFTAEGDVRVYTSTASTLALASTFTTTGGLTIVGALSKGSGTFDIQHPLSNDEDDRLRHSFIEGPRFDLMYRNRVTLKNGKAVIDIDRDSGGAPMKPGTFVALTRDPDVWLNNPAVTWKLEGSKLTLRSKVKNARVAWLVIAERKDKYIMAGAGGTGDKNGYLTKEYRRPPDKMEPVNKVSQIKN
jgi:hypothetical protein